MSHLRQASAYRKVVSLNNRGRMVYNECGDPLPLSGAMPMPAEAMTNTYTLTPTQQTQVDTVLNSIHLSSVFLLIARQGHGKTTCLRALQQQLGGELVTLSDVMARHTGSNPFALEDTVQDLLLEKLQEHEVVLVDDWSELEKAFEGCSYPRERFRDLTLRLLADEAERLHHRLVFAISGDCNVLGAAAFYCNSDRFAPEDYEAICRGYLLPELADSLDYKSIHRFAPKLNAYQIKKTCLLMRSRDVSGTDAFTAILMESGLDSNVALAAVEDVVLDDLKGVDGVIEALEAHVVVPFEKADMFQDLGLKPKRGVLLYGPPGTGKTTVGRALAHRLKGKFFMIDGSFISGSSNFYRQVMRLFQAARENSPSIIFIDDSDVIFEDHSEHGFYRYLLSELDGLENSGSGMICVMMTAMDLGKLPPALIRSGRMELWLEMPMPGATAREAILRRWIGDWPARLKSVDVESVVEATDGFTGADLRRLADDALHLIAYDMAQERPLDPLTCYFHKAAEVVLANREKREQAIAQAQTAEPPRPRFGYTPSFSDLAEDDE